MTRMTEEIGTELFKLNNHRLEVGGFEIAD